MFNSLPNVAIIETMVSGRLVTEPSAAAKSYYAETRDALIRNPAKLSSYFENAFIPWREAFDQPREWESYTDKLTVRRSEYAATSILLDAHDVPGSVQNNPNDPQNELRLRRYKENYRQGVLAQNRDEYTPITIDSLEIARLLQKGGPESDSVSNHVNAQLTMALNRDRAAEFQTLMIAVGEAAGRANTFHIQVPSLAAGADTDDALEFTALVRTMIRQLADFVPFYSPAKVTQTVPQAQARLAIRLSTMQRLGTLGYSTSYNPEYVFALPGSQIVELPDHYFDRNPGLADKDFFIADAGTDQKYGSLVAVDTVYGWGIDPYTIKSSENRALHHASILDTNPFKTFITGGQGSGDQIVLSTIVPSTITGSVYGPNGDVAPSGDVVRGEEYGTLAAVVDADGFPAGGWTVAVTGSTAPSKRTQPVGYGNFVVALDELSSSITVTWTSIIDPSKTVSHSYDVTGTIAAYDGSGLIVTGGTATFAAGSGSGGSITYTNAVGETAQISSDGGTTWTNAGASPIAVPTGQTRRFRKIAATGYVYSDGSQVKSYGPWTAA